MAPWVGVGGICLAVGREWENFMALSLHEPEITLSIYIFVSFVLRWKESGRTNPSILENEADCEFCNDKFQRDHCLDNTHYLVLFVRKISMNIHNVKQSISYSIMNNIVVIAVVNVSPHYQRRKTTTKLVLNVKVAINS